MTEQDTYDVVIVGAGHNGLVAACYLGMAGRRVLVLEKNEHIGGATFSKPVFPGVAARLSVYSYLVSLLPQKILTDLGLDFQVRQRAIASYTPTLQDGQPRGLLISNRSEAHTQRSFAAFTGSEQEYLRYRQLMAKIEIFAQKVWPTLLEPLPAKAELRARFQTPEERAIWDALVENPLGALIEDHLSDDTLRGAVFTDAKIGVLTSPHDPSLLQNRTFLYHTIGQGTGEWRVPVGGMGALVAALQAKAQAHGVRLRTSAEVLRVDPRAAGCTVYYRDGSRPHAEQAVDARYVLFNTASNIASRCLPGVFPEQQVEGAVFKINMVLKKLPALKDPAVSPQEAFSGTFHLNEGYQHMQLAHQKALAGERIDQLPGEMYCHTLTDPSILSDDLQQRGYHTLTLFGLDVPYAWFERDNELVREEVLHKYLRSINTFLAEDIYDCLATDADGRPCVEAKSPLDLETALGLPRGNIFHGNLSWPFAEDEAQAGTWGVETRYPNVLMCGSSAKRGGAVSGLPGHHAAMKVLGRASG